MKFTTRGGLAAGLVAAAVSTASAGSLPNVTCEWDQLMLDAIALNPPAPTATTWKMHFVFSAIYDAWSMYDDEALPYYADPSLKRPAKEHTLANRHKAISYAAYAALSRVYIVQTPLFAAKMAELGYPISQSVDASTPDGLANLCAINILQERANDGSNWIGGFLQIPNARWPQTYAPVNAANPEAPNAPCGPQFIENRWQPLRVPNGTLVDENGIPVFDNGDPSTFIDQIFLTPHWGGVMPFALKHFNQFLPPPPPAFGSVAPYTDGLGQTMTNDEAAWAQMDELLVINALLTDEHKVIAEFWADGPQTWTPPGHWNQLAQGLAIRDNQTMDESVKMFFALNAALLDAGISCWEAKRAFDYVRPVSAIRHQLCDEQIAGWGGPNQGTQIISGHEWQPYQQMTFVTPAFAEFTSGHSTFSRAAREVLLAFTGSDALYDGVTLLDRDYDGDGEIDLMGRHRAIAGSLTFEDGPAEAVELIWPTLLDASNEAGFSRRYGGIHFQDGDLRAREAGRQIGLQSFAKAQAYWSPRAADIHRDGSVDLDDLLLLLSRWGSSGPEADIDGNGIVGMGDLIILLNDWG